MSRGFESAHEKPSPCSCRNGSHSHTPPGVANDAAGSAAAVSAARAAVPAAIHATAAGPLSRGAHGFRTAGSQRNGACSESIGRAALFWLGCSGGVCAECLRWDGAGLLPAWRGSGLDGVYARKRSDDGLRAGVRPSTAADVSASRPHGTGWSAHAVSERS
jgi:hypothetical protein